MNRTKNITVGAVDAVHGGSVANNSTDFCDSRFSLVFIVRGEGTLGVEGGEYPLSENTVFLTRPLVFYQISSRTELSYAQIFFPDAALNDSFIKSSFSGETSLSFGRFYQSFPYPALVLSIFERIFDSEQLPLDSRAPYALALISELLILLRSASGEYIANDTSTIGARVVAYLNDNITADTTLDALAHVFFVSKHYLCRAFKSYTGIPIHSYITRKRIMLSKQLIADGESASSVAYKVGFGDYSAFYRAFVKYTGASPTA